MNGHADLLTNINILHLITSPNREIPPYLKKGEFHAGLSRDRRMLANLPRSNEATSRVPKDQLAHKAYAGLTNQVPPLCS